MTLQGRDQVIYKGETHGMVNQPLGKYLSYMLHAFHFVSVSTTLWRGYTAVWSIEEGRLYLKKVEGVLVTHTGSKHACLDDLFPGYPDRVFAHWFTGTLQCPIGSRLENPRGGLGGGNTPIYEQDLLIELKAGEVVGERIRNNPENQNPE